VNRLIAQIEERLSREVEATVRAQEKRRRWLEDGNREPEDTPAGQTDNNSVEGQILAAIRDGVSLTTTDVRKRVLGGHEKVDAALASLEAAGAISGSPQIRPDKKGRSPSVKVWSLSSDAAEAGIPDEDSISEEADDEDDY
jgi:hypothetical protein